MMDSARRRDDGGGPRGDRLRREISGRLVEWRKTFIASNGRNPRKDEVPKEQRALLRELTNLKRDRGVPEATAPSQPPPFVFGIFCSWNPKRRWR